MDCRLGCGACCIAPSITSALPGMPNGKLAGQRCVNLDDDNLCLLFGLPTRPLVCAVFTADAEVCGQTQQQAMTIIASLELSTLANVVEEG
ncbi:hypothetical protein SIN8267_02540 [Sinobacterium norvegicum]|uniref:YkgJ family cysteine cluster protein n=1 Tax=Sinobacterium norvegicum TaxID=1641715 RepID=A0ABN8EJ36_9GAMM|nr:YkgJ family cysteine cluster protein [Sinobacterium norvegicum]CAH0992420.1 hypothetical protein SIN8267_02540 [Sinobacterium norvegicum]